ncbi:MAG: hypothetical protein ACP5I1_03940, partial [Candidatus Hinthialibacter sp.]
QANPFDKFQLGLRQMLEERLGVKADFSVDPMTVVSRGAAIFAGTQRLKAVPAQSLAKDCYRIELDYNPIDSDPEPLAAGTVIVSEDEAISNWTIELIESKSQWRSGGIRIDEKGFFMTNLRAEKGRRNEFLIELKNQYGNKLKTDPDRIIYTLGATISSQPLIHSIGVALANSKVSVFLKKGSDLPIRRREIFQTTQYIKKGQSGSFLNIPVVEGENWDRADRNHLIGNLKVSGQAVRRDVSAGSEVEVTITIDESRQAHALAYVPVLDEEFEEVLTLEKESSNWETLNQEIQLEKERFASLSETAQETGYSPALDLLEKMQRQDLMAEIERTLSAARSDQDALDKAQNQLIDLRKIMDEMESLVEWPKLERETQELFDQIEEILKRRESEMSLPTFRLIRQETEKVLQSRQQSALRQKNEKLKEYYLQLMEGEPAYWVEYYHYLEQRREQFGDSPDADFCFEQGKRALATNNLRLLESSVRHLAALAPAESPIEFNNLNSTLMPLIR